MADSSTTEQATNAVPNGVRDFTSEVGPTTPLERLSYGCASALASTIAVPLLIYSILMLINMIIVWREPETIAPINPKANAWSSCVVAWTFWGVVAFAGFWLARRAMARRRVVGCIVSADALTLLTPREPIEIPLADIHECRAIDHYDFIVEAAAEANADPNPRLWFATARLMHPFKHPKHRQGVAIWRQMPIARERGNPLILFVLKDGRRFVFDVDRASEVISVVNQRRADSPLDGVNPRAVRA